MPTNSTEWRRRLCRLIAEWNEARIRLRPIAPADAEAWDDGVEFLTALLREWDAHEPVARPDHQCERCKALTDSGGICAASRRMLGVWE